MVGSGRGINWGCIKDYSTFLLSIMTRLCKLCFFPPEQERGICSPGFNLLSQMKVLRACVGSEPAEKHLCLVLVTPALLKVPDRLLMLMLLLDMHGESKGGARKGHGRNLVLY